MLHFLNSNVNWIAFIKFKLTFVPAKDTGQALSIHLLEAIEQILQLIHLVSNILSIESEKSSIQVSLFLHWMVTVLEILEVVSNLFLLLLSGVECLIACTSVALYARPGVFAVGAARHLPLEYGQVNAFLFACRVAKVSHLFLIKILVTA